MKNNIRWLVYSTLALPLVALGIFAASLNATGRAGFFDDLKRKTMNMLAGDFDDASAFSTKPSARGDPAVAGEEVQVSTLTRPLSSLVWTGTATSK